MTAKLTRLFVDAPFAAGGAVELIAAQAHYLINVLRCKAGDRLLVFNGRDGEWRAQLTAASKKGGKLQLEHEVRPQSAGPDLHYLFAPLKRARLDYMAQKATEMGASRLRPVITRRTVAERVNVERLRANAIEAAEQCGVLRVPEVDPPRSLPESLAGWDAARRLIFADESAEHASPLAALEELQSGPLAILIGPEGGFEQEERALLLQHPFVTPISLGPRIMRADTAAVACLALVNASLGDWR